MTADRRSSFVRPGYDCIRNPCGKNGCGTRPGSSHGIHGDEWIYAIRGGDCALTLTVYSGSYPTSVPASVPTLGPKGADLTLHAAFTTDPEDIRTGASGNAECEFVDGGKCFTAWTGCLAADEFFRTHGVPSFEQPESFWQAMEARFEEYAKDARAERADARVQRCATCGGKGLVSTREAQPLPTGAR